MRALLLVPILLLASPAFAGGACLAGDQARDGVIERVRHQMLNKSWQTFYLLRLPKKSCVLDQDDQEHDDQIEIGLFPKDAKRMAALVGKRVHIDGDGPVVGETQWHIRDLTFMGAVATKR
jgi:hypothetical protein